MWTLDALALLVNKVRERLDKLKLSQIPNDAGFITAAQAPVQSVNGATGAVTMAQLMRMTANSATSYPSETGMFAVVANIFSHMTPASYWGLLTIQMVGGYQRHVFTSSNGEVFAGWNESGTVSEPTTWSKLTTPSDFSRSSASPSGNISCANNAWTTICSITIPAGLHWVHAAIHFAANNTGLREVIVTTSAAATATTSRYLHSIVAAAPGGDTVVNVSGAYPTGAQVTLYVRVRQTSGAALNVTSYSGVEVVKIPT